MFLSLFSYLCLCLSLKTHPFLCKPTWPHPQLAAANHHHQKNNNNKTTCGSQFQITNPQSKPSRSEFQITNPQSRPTPITITTKPQFQRPPCQSETHAELLANDPRRSPLNADAHVGQRPTNPPSHKIKSPHWNQNIEPKPMKSNHRT